VVRAVAVVVLQVLTVPAVMVVLVLSIFITRRNNG
jgi:hypothetical protein